MPDRITYHKIRFKITVSDPNQTQAFVRPDGSFVDITFGNGSLFTYNEDAGTLYRAFELALTVTDDTLGSRRLDVIQPFSTTSYYQSYGTSSSAEAIFTDAYWDSYDLHFTLFEVIFNGTTVHTSGPGSVGPYFGEGDGGIANLGILGLGPFMEASRATAVGGFDFKIASGDAWTTLPVQDPPGLITGTGSTNSANLRAYNSLTAGHTVGFASNLKPTLERWNGSAFRYRMGRKLSPKVEYRLTTFVLGVPVYAYYDAMAEIGASTADLTGTAGTFETDVLQRDVFLYVSQFQSGESPYLFPGRVGGTELGDAAIIKYYDEIVDRWSRFYPIPASIVLDGISQGSQYPEAHRLQQLQGDSRYLRVLFGEVGQTSRVGKFAAQKNDYTNVTSKAYTSASSAMYSAPDGSVTVGATTATFTGGTAKIDLASFSAPPYMYGLLADSIDIAATGTGLSYFLEDVFGRRTSVSLVSGSIDLREYSGRRTAGTWAQDWGLRAARNGVTPISDAYPDIPVSGKSHYIWPYASPEKAIGSQMGMDATWAALVITATSGNIVLDHPTLRRTSTLQFILESPDATLVGTGDRWVRFGCVGIDSDPQIEYPGYPTILNDWLGFKRLVLEGKAHDDGKASEVTSLGLTGNPNNRFFREGSVSSYFFGTEQHPHLCWPPLTGTLEQGSGASKNRYEYGLVGSRSFGFGDFLEIHNSGGKISTDGTPNGILYPSTWDATTYGKTHTLKMDGTSLAIVRPYFCYVGQAGIKGVAHLVALASLTSGITYEASCLGGTVTVRTLDGSGAVVATNATGIPADEVALCIVSPYTLLLGVITEGAYKVYSSTGGAFTLMYTVTATGDPQNPVESAPTENMVYHYWLSGSDVKGAIRDAAGNEVVAPFSVTGIGAVEDSGLASCTVYGTGSSRVITLSVIQGGSLNRFRSTDGVAFS